MKQAKTLPNSKESEMMVLGSMLTNIDSLEIASEALNSADFFYSEHRLVFQMLKKSHLAGKPADVHLIAEDLKKVEKLDAIGGVSYLTALAQYAGTSAYIEEYVEDLQKLAQSRALFYLAREMEKMVLENEKPEKILQYSQKEQRNIENFANINEQLPIRFLNQFEENFLTTPPLAKPMLLEYIDETGASVGFLPRSIVAMLVGPGGAGKTHLLAQLAISVACGLPWLNTFETKALSGSENRGNVFLGLGENQYDDIHRLLYKALASVGDASHSIEASSRIAVFSFCGQQAAFLDKRSPSHYFRQLKRRLIQLAPEDGWSLVILDPISRFLGSDAEVDNGAATQFIALLEELTLDLPGNPTVLFAHHVNKAALKDRDEQNQSAARGSSALTDGVRWQGNLIAGEDGKSTLKVTKTNFTAYPASKELEKNSDGTFLIRNYERKF